MFKVKLWIERADFDGLKRNRGQTTFYLSFYLSRNQTWSGHDFSEKSSVRLDAKKKCFPVNPVLYGCIDVGDYFLKLIHNDEIKKNSMI